MKSDELREKLARGSPLGELCNALPALIDLWAACERMALAKTPDDEYRAKVSQLQALRKLEAL